ncbi:MAG: glycosyltransferase [Luteitalea sp.]|nr:glycosyltransferase [Luteitalea sp.]
MPPRALFFHGRLLDVEEELARDPTSLLCIDGASVFNASFLRAVIEHSNREELYLPRLSGSTDPVAHIPAWARPHAKRLRWIDGDELRDVLRRRQLVLMAPDPYLWTLACVRAQVDAHASPITGVIHAIQPIKLASWLSSRMMQLLHEADALVCTSVAGRSAVEKIVEALPTALRGAERIPFRTPIIPLGIEPRLCEEPGRASGDQEARPISLLYVGRLSDTNKADLVPMLLALGDVARQRSVRLTIAGDDRARQCAPVLRAIGAELGLSEVLTVVPNANHEKKWKLLRHADIFVSPVDNVQETFGLSLLEAMLAGLPVVASDWSGYRDIVVHGRTGFLVPTMIGRADRGDEGIDIAGSWQRNAEMAAVTYVDFDSWKHYVTQLVDDAELRSRMGREGRRRVLAEFSWRGVIGAYEALWTELEAGAKRLRCGDRLRPSLRFHDVFEHYASAMLDDASPLYCPGDDLIPSRVALARRWRDTAHAGLLEVLSHVCRRPGLSIVELERTTGKARDELRMAVMRLLKYGALRNGGPRACSTRSPYASTTARP